MQNINFNLNNTKVFIDWLQAGEKKHPKERIAKVATVIPTSIPSAPIPVAPIAVIEIPASVIEVSPPLIEGCVPIIEIPTPIVFPSTLIDRVTVLDLPCPLAPSIYQRALAKLTLRNVSYLILIAGAVACVAYLLYCCKTSKKRIEPLPPEEKNIPVAVEKITISEISEEPLSRLNSTLQEEKSDVKVDSKWSISRETLSKILILGGGAILITIAASFFGRKSPNQQQDSSLFLEEKTKQNGNLFDKTNMLVLLTTPLKGGQSLERGQNNEPSPPPKNPNKTSNSNSPAILQCEEGKSNCSISVGRGHYSSLENCLKEMQDPNWYGEVISLAHQYPSQSMPFSESSPRYLSNKVHATSLSKGSALSKENAGCDPLSVSIFRQGSSQGVTQGGMKELPLGCLDENSFAEGYQTPINSSHFPLSVIEEAVIPKCPLYAAQIRWLDKPGLENEIVFTKNESENGILLFNSR